MSGDHLDLREPSADTGAPAPSGRPPRLVMMVANGVTGDSRVEKAARTAVDAGYEVVVLGIARRSSTGPDLAGPDVLDGIVVDRLPLRTPLTLWSTRDPDRAHARAREMARRAAADQRATLARLRPEVGPSSSPPGRAVAAVERFHRRAHPVSRLLRATWKARVALMSAARGRVAAHDWRRGYPYFADLEAEMGQAAVDLRPDLIHAHDVHVTAAARLASEVLTAQGHPCPWVYDAHEWVSGIPDTDNRARAYASRALEADVVGTASAVITVSPGLAELLTERYSPAHPVTVVANAPSRVRQGLAPGRRPLREEVAVAVGTPLLVYAGGVHPRRGLGTVIEALPLLPGVHLALVAEETPSMRRPLVEQAEALGVADRVHLVSYVPARHVTWFLSGADVGLVPIWRTTSHDSSCPTKVGEYVQAGLPIVTSDTTATADFVRGHGVGEVFTDRNPSDFARAAQAVLTDLDRYREAITDRLLDELSWSGRARPCWGSTPTCSPTARPSLGPTTTADAGPPCRACARPTRSTRAHRPGMPRRPGRRVAASSSRCCAAIAPPTSCPRRTARPWSSPRRRRCSTSSRGPSGARPWWRAWTAGHT